MVITWNTQKTETGFTFRVYTIGYQVEGETLKAGTYPTRARAMAAAKKWTRYFKAQQRAAA